MPIRVIPFDDISVDHVRDLIARNVREDRTLDFKRELVLNHDGRVDLLKDVTAMANASGGTLLYGAVEGAGDDRGMIIDIAPMTLQVDQFQSQIEGLFRESIDDRITGVMHRAFPAPGGWLYVIRVPASPLAPHMVKIRTTEPRFYLRGNTSNDPMTARQIREVTLRTSNAFDRALAVIDQRTERLRERASRRDLLLRNHAEYNGLPDQIALHVIPVFPLPGGINFAVRENLDRLAGIPPFGRREPGVTRMRLDGLYCINEGNDPFPHAHALVLRSGGVEFQKFRIVDEIGHRGSLSRVVQIRGLEDDILSSLHVAEELTEAGFLPLPAVVSLRLFSVGGAGLLSPGFDLSAYRLEEPDVFLDPVLLYGWGDESTRASRGLFDTLWQSWGRWRSEHYDLTTGERLPMDR
jgi:hypothetical protein